MPFHHILYFFDISSDCGGIVMKAISMRVTDCGHIIHNQPKLTCASTAISQQLYQRSKTCDENPHQYAFRNRFICHDTPRD